MDYYDSIADGYEELYREEQLGKIGLIKPFLDRIITKKTRLLDVGCGTGISMEMWGCEKTGIEPSEKLLAIAREKGLDARKAIAESLPFGNETFDVCIAITSLHHADFEKAVNEISRVCKKYFIFSVLKDSALFKSEYEKITGRKFRIIKRIDSKKDVILVCQKDEKPLSSLLRHNKIFKPQNNHLTYG